MQRRAFMGMLGAGMLPAFRAGGAEAEKRTRFYVFETLYLRQGTQPARLHEYFSKGELPALNKVHAGPKIFLDALVAPHMPQVADIIGYQSLEEIWKVHAALRQDKEVMKAFEAWESGPEQAAEEQTNVLLEAADYSPEIVPAAEPRKTSRIFELRVYHRPDLAAAPRPARAVLHARDQDLSPRGHPSYPLRDQRLRSQNPEPHLPDSV